MRSCRACSRVTLIDARRHEVPDAATTSCVATTSKDVPPGALARTDRKNASAVPWDNGLDKELLHFVLDQRRASIQPSPPGRRAIKTHSEASKIPPGELGPHNQTLHNERPRTSNSSYPASALFVGAA